MAFLVDYIRHRRDCQSKQDERSRRIQALPLLHSSLTSAERALLVKPVSEVAEGVKDGALQATDVLQAYGKAALRAHEATNCLTEVMISAAQEWLQDGSINLKGPLAGMPVSIKDNVVVGGFDTCFGYSAKVGNQCAEDGNMIRILKAAGAIPFVKTNIPITLLSFESTNDVWGRCTNPHNKDYSPGGSSGGEGALLAYGGSRIGIGSDIAGSVRLPASWSGCYSLRCSTGRWLRTGIRGTMAQDGIQGVHSPMARTLEDLTYFTEAIIRTEPWKLDHTIHPVPWREDIVKDIQNRRGLSIGLVRTDGIVDPSPACARALEEVHLALKRQGHFVKEVALPDPLEALTVASHLLCADGCRCVDGQRRTGEWQDRGVSQMRRLAKLPWLARWLYHAWVKFVRRDEVWAKLIAGWGHKTMVQYWDLVGRRDAYRKTFFDWWQDEAQVDFLIMPVNATPALPHGCMHDAVASCGYTFLFNMLDYTAGVIPVTHVDKALDQLPPDFLSSSSSYSHSFSSPSSSTSPPSRSNGIARGAYKHYDATAMHGLPVGVQIVGRRLEEEKVLACMRRVEDALSEDGRRYELLELD